jgi:hypothetical protein
MAYKMRKVYKKDCYKVYNTITKRIFAKCTTKEKATRQLAIIRNSVYNSKTVKKSIHHSKI